MFSKGRILDFDYGTIKGIGITQGISADKQYLYDNNVHYAGSNGTYATSFYSFGSYLNVIVSVYEDHDHAHKIDIRDIVLKHNGMSKVSPKLIQYLIDHNKGKKIHLVNSGGDWNLANISELDMNYRC